MKYIIFILITVTTFANTIYSNELKDNSSDLTNQNEFVESNEEEKSNSLSFSGIIRNDSIAVKFEDHNEYSNILETRIVLNKNIEKWKFYADGRVYLYYGKISETASKQKVKLKRSFIRYYQEYYDVTVGKTYINFGIPGVFNPFELDKNLYFSDISYAKEGSMAGELQFSFGDFSGGKTYFSHNDTLSNYSTGFSLWSNMGGFDFGMVANRKGSDRKNPSKTKIYKSTNVTGIYIKGDAGVEIQSSYAFHFKDEINGYYGEAMVGFDYSFFASKLILETKFYYNGNGTKSQEKYKPSMDTYFYAPYYFYGLSSFSYDEFLKFSAGIIYNITDRSAVVFPSVSYVIANGLTASLQVAIATGKNNQEFSDNLYGETSALIRIEGKY